LRDQFESVLGHVHGRAQRRPLPVSAATLELVREAAQRGEIERVHELVGDVGPAHLRADAAIRDALVPLCRHFDVSDQAPVEVALWERLRCDPRAAQRVLLGEVEAVFVNELGALLDSSRTPTHEQLQETAWRARGKATAELVLDALRSYVSEGIVRMGLTDEYETVRERLGSQEQDPTASVLDVHDANELICAFERAYTIAHDLTATGYQLERELARKLIARANAAATRRTG